MSEGDRAFSARIEPNPDGSNLVVVAGEVDTDTSSQLQSVLAQAGMGATAVALDLAAVSFIDSSGLTVVASAYSSASAAGLDFTVGGARPSVRRVFQITGLGSLLAPEG